MRERKWVNCPSCGAQGSMRGCHDLVERFSLRGYKPVDVDGLDGQFCDTCGDGFWSLKSEKRIARALAAHRAEEDSRRVVAAELVSVQEAAKAMHISVQGVHKMMDEGRLRYAIAGGFRLPLREELAEKAKGRRCVPARQ